MKAKKAKVKPEAANAALAANKGPVSKFIAHHYRHFNAAALVDAAKAYESHLAAGGKMLVTLAGAMSTAARGAAPAVGPGVGGVGKGRALYSGTGR